MKNDILLVDDEDGIRKVLGISLADRGYTVHTACDAKQAVAIFDDRKPGIVLTDIKMPGMDGIELLKVLKQRDPEVEVIMITGHGDISLAIKSLKLEATDFIVKPIDEDALDVALKRAGERIDMRSQLRDYTQNLEQLVEEKSHRLIQAERLAAMGETVAGLAHAIKNIAGGLKGGAFVVEKGLSLNNSQYLQQGWQMVQDNVSRIEQLSLDLLNIAKPGIPNFQYTDPAVPLQQVYKLMQPQAKQYGIRMTVKIGSDFPQIAMEPESIHRCLMNLVTNAVDACCQGICGNQEPEIILSAHIGRSWLIYQVRDNCGGMDPEVQKQLFKGFFTTKGSRGTGIGLMLSRKIIEDHQGNIRVFSEQGHGSLFRIRLPLRNEMS
ncbi:MAG: response regulator [Desulfobacteraceae bacterium]|nr:response regulator [Desulfobacteraceae bacterium]